MIPREAAALVGVTLLAAVALFQLLLALGLPLGRAAWGGQYRVLPKSLRRASLTAIGLLGLAGWALLACAEMAWPGGGTAARIVCWVLAGYFALNVALNALSKSRVERAIMLPVSILLVAAFILVLLGRS